MVSEKTVPPFFEWIPLAAINWLLVAGSLLVFGLLLGFLLTVVTHGPVAGIRRFFRTLVSGAVDLVCMNPRRVAALSWLAVKESIRRRVLVVFLVLFVLVLLFADLLLDPRSTNPARLYLSFVLTVSSYLVLVLMLFLSVFSLPADLKSRTLHTVVTKPVRPSEIVAGRMIGFTILGTLLLAVMCLINYPFVVLGLDHTHTLTAEDFSPAGQAAGGPGKAAIGVTGESQGHSHEVALPSSEEGSTEMARGHRHSVRVEGAGGRTRYVLGPPEGQLMARVPVYGKLMFRDREGNDAEKGINVGDEWTYRSFIEGGSQAAAIWTFDGMRPDRFPEALPVEMTLGVFRTYKGDIEKGVLGSISVRNPSTGLTVEVEIFESKEFATKDVEIPRTIDRFSSAQMISRKIDTPAGEVLSPPQVDPRLAEKTSFDLYDDLTDNGRMEIWLRCLEPKQYFGAAQGDLYLKASDASFELNFVKGYFGIWLQMVIVIAFGVMFSTFLSGAVAMTATLAVLVGGFFGDFMQQLALGKTYGGGPLESLIRIFTHQNVMSDLNPGLGGEVAKMMDLVMAYFLRVMAALLPPFADFSNAAFVAYGFNVSWDLVLVRLVSLLGIVLPVFVIGFFFLKTREVAR